MPMSKALNFGAALTIGMLLSLPGARAESPPAAPLTEAEIEPIVQRGIDLRRNGRDPEALAVFEGALARAPQSTRLSVHIAATHQALGHWVEAERYLSQALRRVDDPYIRRHRATLESAYQFVDSRLGSLDVAGGPAGAQLVLSGRSIGQLPLDAPVRVPIGSYLLEVRKEGYYSVSRPIAIGGGTLLRESVTLGERVAGTPAWTASTAPASSNEEDSHGSPRWLTWTLAGAGMGAAAATAVALAVREEHASRWNGNGCLMPGFTRGQMCRDELDSGRSAERWGIGLGIVSGVLLGGAATSFFLERRPPSEAPSLALDGCGVDGAGARCFGSF
jgi:tetratricopeptide repeat protein/PEGA domain-containing protein